jgi:L-fuconolactonase
MTTGATSNPPGPVVDSHIHFWEVPRHNRPGGWYPTITEWDPANEISHIGERAGLIRDYLVDDYMEDVKSAGIDVDKVVHTSATSAPHAFLDEARWLEQMATETGWPSALIGSITPSADISSIAREIEKQSESELFRGVRVLIGLDPASRKTEQLLRILADGGWIFDLVVRPWEAAAYAAAIDRVPDLSVAVEHAGWPGSADARGFREWRMAMTRLAAMDNVHCKISGLALTLNSLRMGDQRPFIEACFELFGPQRCMFGSDFPIDSLFGPFRAIVDTCREASAELDAAAQMKFWHDNAQRLYRL